MEQKEIKITDIKVENRIREANSEKVAELAESINEIGLLNPIIVDKDNKLIAGLHRLEAFKLLGKDTILAMIDEEESSLKKELKEIDENLIRAELHYTERGDLLVRRKEIYEELYPETKQGGAPGAGQGKGSKPVLEENFKNFLPKTFVEDTATKLGITRSPIQKEIQISKQVIPEVKKKLKDYDIGKGTALQFTGIDEEEQKEIIDKAERAKKSKKESKSIIRRGLDKALEEKKAREREQEIKDLKEEVKEVKEIVVGIRETTEKEREEDRKKKDKEILKAHQEEARTHADAIKIGMESLAEHVKFFKESEEDRNILREVFNFDEYMKIAQTLTSMMISEEEYGVLVRTSKDIGGNEII